MFRFTSFIAATIATVTALSADEKAPLPEGTAGIAAQFPGDRGIEQDPNVVFVENFDDSLESVVQRWEAVKEKQLLSLSSDIPPDSHGKTSLQVAHVGGEGSGAHLYRQLQPGYNKLHYRFYVKFSEDCAPIHHFFHVGGYNPPTPWPQGGAGTRPRGDERLTVGVEPFGEEWRWDYYTYWMEMRGSPPRGQTWGNSFVHNPAAAVTKGNWQCLELMVQLNEVGESNGELALWIDGQLISHLGEGFPEGMWIYDKFLPGRGGEGVRWNDQRQGPEPIQFAEGGEPFEGFQWRSTDDLQLNFLWLLIYITQAPPGHTSHIWFDNIVVADRYIGPIQPPQ